jgi:hypothetical protein
VSGDAADEEASRVFMDGDWSTQEPGQERAQGGYGDEAAPVFDQEDGWEIGIPALNAGAVLASDKFALDIVVADAPTLAVESGADSAEGVEEFEQPNVIVVRSLNDGQGVVSRDGVDREMLLGSGAQKK